MKRVWIAAVLLFTILSARNIFAQAGNGQVGGIVQDSTKALIPGVTVTLTNKSTGVADTRLSNDSGAYNFPSVPPGTYTVTAALTGFKTSTANDLLVNANSQVRWNFTLDVGTANTQVEVSVAADQRLTEVTASVGVNLTQQKVTDLPMVGQNVLDLLNVLPGFRASPVNDSASTVGGLSLDTVNTTIDGLSSVSSRDSASLWGRQVMTTNVINPDLVGEIKLILSPVDAELGRGNAQIQIQTRSGTNKYTGSAVWNVQNTALNANTWANKRNPGPATQPNWYNLNQITGSFGGPIIKNKTFFFALYDMQLVNRRSLLSTPVLTDSARQGIWRYWEGWNPGAALTPEPTSFASVGATPTGTAAAVDFNGNPLAPNFNPTGGPYTLGGLRCFSIFGNVKADGSPFGPADCPGGTAVVNAGPWDTFRPTMDTTGFMQRVLSLMPHANFFAATGGAPGTDGLNTATYRRIQGTHGPDGGSVGTIIGTVGNANDYNGRKQINLKIDHNINPKHRISANWTYEHTGGPLSLSGWGTGLDGQTRRRPQFLTLNGTSTLSPSLVNEARFGVNYSSEFATSPWDNLDSADIMAKAQQFILYGGSNATNGKQYPILFNPGTNWNGYMFPAAGQFSWDLGNYSPLWDYSDTVRWTHQKHSFSIGGEYRRPETTGYNSTAYVNSSPGNAGGTTTPQFFTSGNLTNGAAQLPNFLATTRNNTGTVLNAFNGAINAPTTTYWIDGQKDIQNGTWQDVTTATNRIPSADPYGHQTRTQIGNEFSFFVKDDFKVHPRLTANIGIRYDYVKSLYLTEGLTNRFVGDGLGLFGAGRPAGNDPFVGWLTPGNLYLSGYGSNAANPLKCVQGAVNPNGIPASNCDPNLMSTVIFVGPGTSNPDQTLIPQSGRWSPALGLSWQLPWFGEGKTTVRGGFQRTYGQAGSQFTGGLLSGPGADGTSSTNLSLPEVQSILATRALNLSDLPLLVPAAPVRAPQNITFPVGARRVGVTYAMYSADYATPYTDNYTLSIQRMLRRNMTLELRSVNTLAKDQPGGGGPFGTPGTFDLNTVNVYHNPELFQALQNTRAGIDDPLFDQMLMGLTLVPGAGAVGTTPAGGVLQRGSSQLRRSTATAVANGPTIASALANGNYATVISALLGANTTTGLQALPTDPSTGTLLNTSQRVLRNGCDRLANNQTGGFIDPNSGATILPRCFPENYFVANPQLTTAEYAKNLGYTDYNAFEAQFTMSSTYGISLQATYSYSKTLALPGSGFTDPLNPQLDYGRTLSSIGNDFRTNGTFELPIGPNKLVMGNSSGWVARTVERWQMGFIYSISSGAPRSFLTGNNMLYANGRPNIVGPWDNPQGNVEWNGQNGYFFGDTKYATYQDPQCLNVTTNDNLRASCSLLGLAKVVPAGTPGAIQVSQGRFGIPLLENPTPGTQGNLGSLTMATFPRWNFDANISKTFRITESKTVQFRMDALNMFNHPTPADPIGLANSGSSFNDNFGQITTKTGSRTFQAKLRFTF